MSAILRQALPGAGGLQSSGFMAKSKSCDWAISNTVGLHMSRKVQNRILVTGGLVLTMPGSRRLSRRVANSAKSKFGNWVMTVARTQTMSGGLRLNRRVAKS